jgi:hypothetical protein
MTTNMSFDLYYPLAYPNVITDIERREFEKSDLYFLAAEMSVIHNLRVRKIVPPITLFHDKHMMEVYMARADGFNAVKLTLKKPSDGPMAFIVDSAIRPNRNEYKRIGESAKIKYLMNKYKQYLDNSVESTMSTADVLDSAFVVLTDRLKDNSAEMRRDFHWFAEMDTSPEIMQQLVETAIGKRGAMGDLGLLKMKAVYHKYETYMTKREEAKRDLVNLLSGPKYVIGTVLGGSIVGKGIVFGVTKVTANLNVANDLQFNTALNNPHCELIEPIKWYPSFDHIPEKYQDEVKAKLTFARLAREPNSYDKRDPDGYLPPVCQSMWQRSLNMAAWNSGYGDTHMQFLVFDKKVEV